MPFATHQRARAALDEARIAFALCPAGPRQAEAGDARACARSTFIVGYPGETEAEFEELFDFVRKLASIASACSSIRKKRGRRRRSFRIKCRKKSSASDMRA
jgi:hypothetical protein